jgi:hypothetical protein
MAVKLSVVGMFLTCDEIARSALCGMLKDFSYVSENILLIFMMKLINREQSKCITCQEDATF